MAAVVTVVENRLNVVKKIVWSWLSHTDGTASLATTLPYTGEIIRLVTVPDAVAAPTTLYDVAVTDADSVDCLMGAGADRSATVTEQVLGSSLGCVAGDILTLAITNAGSGKEGTVILYIR